MQSMPNLLTLQRIFVERYVGCAAALAGKLGHLQLRCHFEPVVWQRHCRRQVLAIGIGLICQRQPQSQQDHKGWPSNYVDQTFTSWCANIIKIGYCGERSLAHTTDEIQRQLKKGFLGYQCASLGSHSSIHRSIDLTKDETRSIWCWKWSQINKIRFK